VIVAVGMISLMPGVVIPSEASVGVTGAGVKLGATCSDELLGVSASPVSPAGVMVGSNVRVAVAPGSALSSGSAVSSSALVAVGRSVGRMSTVGWMSLRSTRFEVGCTFSPASL